MTASVTIITPMFNSEDFISETINSVISQTYKNWELILIDDCSSDSTLKIIQPFLEIHTNIKLLKNEVNSGAAVSRNKGGQLAKGDYIAFLDADDLWHPKKLETQIAFMQKENCHVSFTSYQLIDQDGKLLNTEVKALKSLSYPKLLKSNYVGNLTGMYNAKVLGEITAPNLRKRQDWLLWLAAIKKSGKDARGVQEPLAYYRVHQNSISANKLSLVKHNYWVYKKGLGFSTLKSTWCMLVFLREHFFVKSKQIVKLNKS
ncbi:glycosyltransferase family 2 protein [Algibacter lectus]|uniref:glycosyltransferase family 2 protein n=1 Tax=Algibacter lectus TaxID=221126 RepID=UPI0011142FA2|nr:glycosyltransferase [Algibacter lectus]